MLCKTFKTFVVRLPSVQFFYDYYFVNFAEFSRMHSPINFLRRFNSYFVSFSCTILAFHRLTAICKYASHEKFWKASYRYWLIYVFVTPFIFSFQELFNKTKFAPFEVGNTTDYYIVSSNEVNIIVSFKNYSNVENILVANF